MLSFQRPDLEQFLKTYEINLFAVSNDEKRIAISTNISGSYDIWMLELPSTYPYRLSNVEQKADRLMFDPNNRHLLLSIDEDGDENPQIFAVSLHGGPLLPVIKNEHSKNHLQAISPDGKNLYYASDKDNPTFMNSYKKNIVTDVEKTILVGEGALTFITSVSPDEKSFTFNKASSNLFMSGFVKQGDEINSLVPNPNKEHLVRSPHFLDNDTIYFWTDYEKDFSYVAKYTISSKDFNMVWEVNGQDVNDICIDQTHSLLYAFTSNGVEENLYQINLEDQSFVRISMPISIVHKKQILPSGNLYICGESETKPTNIYRLNYLSGEWESITQNRVMGVSPKELTPGKTLTYKSFDGRNIEAILYEPDEKLLNGYTIVWCHGGPHSAEKKRYRGLFQFLCSQGYKIFAPNFRGSTGYGSSFAKLAEQDWGTGPRLDVVEGIEWIINQGISNQSKLFLMGGSFGGYLSLLLHGKHSKYFKAVVDMYGESDLIAFLESVPTSWKPLMKKRLGDPLIDKERLINDSPITYVDNMTKPMLVIQGKNDTRVVKAQSDIIVNALKERNRKVEYIVIEDEGHGFSKKHNEIFVYNQILNFLNKYTD